MDTKGDRQPIKARQDLTGFHWTGHYSPGPAITLLDDPSRDKFGQNKT
jgi:hypothetical protein